MHIFWEKGYEGASLTRFDRGDGHPAGEPLCGLWKQTGSFRTGAGPLLAGPVAFMHAALEEPTAFAVAERILCESAEFLTKGGHDTDA